MRASSSASRYASTVDGAPGSRVADAGRVPASGHRHHTALAGRRPTRNGTTAANSLTADRDTSVAEIDRAGPEEQLPVSGGSRLVTRSSTAPDGSVRVTASAVRRSCQRRSHSAVSPPHACTYARVTGNDGSAAPLAAADRAEAEYPDRCASSRYRGRPAAIRNCRSSQAKACNGPTVGSTIRSGLPMRTPVDTAGPLRARVAIHDFKICTAVSSAVPVRISVTRTAQSGHYALRINSRFAAAQQIRPHVGNAWPEHANGEQQRRRGPPCTAAVLRALPLISCSDRRSTGCWSTTRPLQLATSQARHRLAASAGPVIGRWAI
jgi:hypothetical protein